MESLHTRIPNMKAFATIVVFVAWMLLYLVALSTKIALKRPLNYCSLS